MIDGTAVLWLSVLAFVVPSARASAPGAIAVSGGLVEGLPSPLSVPTTTPRFSWQLSLPPPRNPTQAAYHLRVGTTAALVGGAGADACDTGGVASASSWLVAPPCAALAAGGSYWWSVQVTTSDGSVSPFSAPQRFAVGLQGRTDWSASAAFIGYAKGADQSSTPWFRTRFELSAPELAAVRAGTSAALLHVASAGFHEAYVNACAPRARVYAHSVQLQPQRARIGPHI